jgi:hypothetical protein
LRLELVEASASLSIQLLKEDLKDDDGSLQLDSGTLTKIARWPTWKSHPTPEGNFNRTKIHGTALTSPSEHP